MSACGHDCTDDNYAINSDGEAVCEACVINDLVYDLFCFFDDLPLHAEEGERKLAA